MPYSVVFSPEASDQLEALLFYIALESSLSVASRYVEAVVDTCENLVLFPLHGVAREDIRPGLRVTHHKGRTVIAYAVDDVASVVSIVGVFYGGQSLEGFWSDDQER